MKNVQKSVPSLFILIALVGFPQISESIFTPVLPAISEALSVTAQTSQLTMGSYFVGFAIGVLFWGRLSDGIGRRRPCFGDWQSIYSATLPCGWRLVSTCCS